MANDKRLVAGLAMVTAAFAAVSDCCFILFFDLLTFGSSNGSKITKSGFSLEDFLAVSSGMRPPLSK